MKVRVEINMGTADAPEWKAFMLSSLTLKMYKTSVIFNDKGGDFSQVVTVDTEMNRHIFGSSAMAHGDRLYGMVDGKQGRLTLEGVPFFFGKWSLGKEVSVKEGKVEMTLCANGKEWEELLKDKKLTDLDILGKKIAIGMCFSDDIKGVARMRQGLLTNLRENPTADKNGANNWIWDSFAWAPDQDGQVSDNNGWFNFFFDGLTIPKVLLYHPRYVNVSAAYNPRNPMEHPFCNVRTCYQKYRMNSDTTNGQKWEKERGYVVHEPTEDNSAPCFYVLFVLDMIFDALKVRKRSNALEREIDMKRLAIVHSNPAYAYRDANGVPMEDKLDTISVGGEAKFEQGTFECELMYRAGRQYNALPVYYKGERLVGNGVWYKNAEGQDCYSVTEVERRALFTEVNLYRAFATSENLPEISFDEFISSLENAFGARFVYDSETGAVDVVLIQDVLTSKDVVAYDCVVVSEEKTEKDIRGFELGYSASKGLEKNAITGEEKLSSGNDDTVYQYNDYRNVVVMQPNSAANGVPRNFREMIFAVNDHNMNLYYDVATGNTTRVKVDKDAKTPSEWFPSMMEVNQYRSVRIGDCSDDEYVEKKTIGFAPMISNIVNVKEIYDQGSSGAESGEVASPKYAMFCDGELHTKDDGSLVEQDYIYDAMSLGSMTNKNGDTTQRAHLDLTLRTKMKFNYDANGSDPFFDAKPTFTLGIMRGSGSDAYIQVVTQNYDEQESNLCARVAGSDAEFCSDSVNDMGEPYDYNGTIEGTGYESVRDLLSLKLKAEKTVNGGADAFADADGTPNSAYYPIDAEVAKRGLFDKFWWAYAYLMLNGVWVKKKVMMSLAEAMSIDVMKMARFGDTVGWIVKYEWEVDLDSGMVMVEVEMVCL